MRVTQRTMYQTFVSDMNRNLSDYMDSNEQGGSQKRINRPSDDPVGMTRVLMYRNGISQTKQFESNASMAQGWLQYTDSVLESTSSALTKLIGLASGMSTSSVTDENRKQASFEMRQILGQLLNASNSEFMDGRKLFGGHKYDSSAFEMGLGITTTDPNLQNLYSDTDEKLGVVPWQVTGGADSTITLRFETDGEIGVDDLDYSWSADGGKTWSSGTLLAGDTEINMNGVKLTVPVPNNPATPPPDTKPLKVTAYDPNKPMGSENGSVLYVRPAVYYKGDDANPPPKVDSYGSTNDIASLKATGLFKQDVRVRMDENVDISVPGAEVKYSYSLDNGITWKSATTKAKGGNELELPMGDGFLNIELTPPASTINKDHQFVVRPQRAELGYEIMPGENISVTNVGKDIFGGLYGADGEVPTAVFDGSSKNVFEVVGRLIAFAETNNQTGVSKALAELKDAQKHILTSLASVGGKENRVSTAQTMLATNRDTQTSRMSKIEDVDLTELLTRLASQQLSYQTVLKSSSMIMQLNLTKFL